MRISELLEATFQGHVCTKDCRGHNAGYQWALKHSNKECDAKSSSFKAGCEIAKKQVADKQKQAKLSDYQDVDADEEV